MLKHLQVELPSGQFSHRDTLRTFESLLKERAIKVDEAIIKIIEDLMAFRHVATKIYGFLIDANKLAVVVNAIEQNHLRIKKLFDDISNIISE